MNYFTEALKQELQSQITGGNAVPMTGGLGSNPVMPLPADQEDIPYVVPTASGIVDNSVDMQGVIEAVTAYNNGENVSPEESYETLRPLQDTLSMSRGIDQTELTFTESARVPRSVLEAGVSRTPLSFNRDEQGRPTESPLPEARPDDLEVDFEELMAGQLRRHEGYRPYPYKDSRGLWTIGIGHLIGDGSSKGEYAQYSEDNPMTEEQVQELFREDYQEHLEIAEEYPFWDRLDVSGKRAILDMTFNMGNLMSGWSDTMELISQGKLDEAATIIENSLYARQVGQRANTVADMLRNAEIEPLAPKESLVPRPRPNTQD